MWHSGLPTDGEGNAGLLPAPYDRFMRSHLRYNGYFQGQESCGQKSLVFPGNPTEEPPAGPRQELSWSPARFESGNLQRAIMVGPFEYVLRLRPDLYTTKHTQWCYFCIQNTRKDQLYCFTITYLAKPKSLYGEGMWPLFYSQRDAQSGGIGYYQGSGGEETAVFCLSWTSHFPHDADTCFLAHSYPYTYSDLQRYLRALACDPECSWYCAVRVLCRTLSGTLSSC